MKVPTKGTLEKIQEHHRGWRIRVTRSATTLLVLYYWIYTKKLAKDCDDFAFQQKKVMIAEDTVSHCAPKVLLTFNEYEKVRRRRLHKMELSKTKSNEGDSKKTNASSSNYLSLEGSVMKKK